MKLYTILLEVQKPAMPASAWSHVKLTKDGKQRWHAIGWQFCPICGQICRKIKNGTTS